MVKESTNHQSLSYSELHKKTTTLASLLRSIAGPDIVIGVSVARSINLVVAMWSVLRAGAVLLPLENTATPALAHKIKDALPRLIIVDNSTESLFAGTTGLTLVNIDKWTNIKSVVNSLSSTLKVEKAKPENVAYITYTSGSTGEPKGSMTTNLGLTNAAYAIEDRGLPQGAKVLCTAQHIFDCWFFEMLEALMCGGTIHLIAENGRLSQQFLEVVIRTHEINAITILPLLSNYLQFSQLPSLIDVVIMGEIAYPETIKRLEKIVKDRQASGRPLIIRIEYGVQEATIFSTEHPYQFGSVPYTAIGKPIRNTEIYILDKDGIREQPIGVSGEIYIAGPSLGRGYVNNSALNRGKIY